MSLLSQTHAAFQASDMSVVKEERFVFKTEWYDKIVNGEITLVFELECSLNERSSAFDIGELTVVSTALAKYGAKSDGKLQARVQTTQLASGELEEMSFELFAQRLQLLVRTHRSGMPTVRM